MPIPINEFDSGVLSSTTKTQLENELKQVPVPAKDLFEDFRGLYIIEYNPNQKTVTMWRRQVAKVSPCMFCGHAEEHPCHREGCTCQTHIPWKAKR